LLSNASTQMPKIPAPVALSVTVPVISPPLTIDALIPDAVAPAVTATAPALANIASPLPPDVRNAGQAPEHS
jgi:hypothetical protein